MVGETIGERYELEELVGTGGMSSVYRAHDSLLERHVALKILHAQYGTDGEYVERFRREARAVAQLSHPNIVTVIDRGEEAGRQFIVFEYVEGENLKEYVERTGPLPAREALDFGIQVARGLAFAHGQGLVHRDVKPQNVLLDHDGRAKVTDFGIARSLDVEHGVTQTGTVLGTSNYIAPEQASGQRVDALSDVYSLGVVLWELLTAEVPFPGDNFVAVAMRHIGEPAPSVLERRPDCPVRLATAIERAMAKDPADRFPTMDALAAELEACLAELGEPAGDRTLIAQTPVVRAGGHHRMRSRRRWLVPLVVLVLGLAGLGAVVGVYLSGRHSTASGARHGSTATVTNVVHAASLSGVGAYDPYGSNGEHDSAAPNATDGNPATYWETEHYRDGLNKKGVGLVLDAGKAVSLSKVTVTSSTPGFTAEIEAGSSRSGPFRPVSGSQAVGARTTFALDVASSERYYVVWITDLGGLASARVNEVTTST